MTQLDFEENFSVLARVDDLRKSYDGQAVLNGVSLELRRGEVILLRGSNGSGKTTLLNILSAYVTPDAGTIYLSINEKERIFSFPQRFWQKLNPLTHFTPERIVQKGLCRTWQELRLFSTLDLRNNIAIASPGQYGENPIAAVLQRPRIRLREQDLLSASEAMLSRIGLAGRERSSADMISLGQSKRVAIARAIQTGAKILCLDEPLAGLDKQGITEVMDLLRDLVRKTPITLVIIEHVLNIPEILSLATRVWTLSEGRLHIETTAEVRSSLTPADSNGNDGFLQRLAGPRGEIVEEELPRGAWLSRVIPQGSESNPPVIEIQDLVIKLGKRVIIGEQKGASTLKGMNLSIRKGQTVVLRAPNGWGKTTLLRALAGIYPIVRGSIKMNGIEISSLPSWQRAKAGLSLLQAQSFSFPTLTVRETLHLSHIIYVPSCIEHLLDRYVSDLSGGEKQLISMFCALGVDKPVALLDEPFSALDASGHARLETLLSQRSGATFIAVPGHHIP